MTEISRLKYIQWRPIGVCDVGVGKQRKAKIFSKADLLSITSPGIGRRNWRENPKILKIIKIYAQDVAEMSTLTEGMVNPEISNIKLVGAVLEHYQTPHLNQESMDGRVQFFQVTFKDLKNQKTSRIKWKNYFKVVLIFFLIVVSIIFLYLFYNYSSELSFNKVQESVSKCGANRQNISYLEELRDIRKSFITELNSLPEWLSFKESRLLCSGSRKSVNNQEQLLLDCFITARKNTKNIIFNSPPSFNRIESCVIALCKRNLKHLASKCKRL